MNVRMPECCQPCHLPDSCHKDTLTQSAPISILTSLCCTGLVKFEEKAQAGYTIGEVKACNP